MEKKIILDKKNIQRVLSRMAHEILEFNKGTENIVLIGISTGGTTLSKKLQDSIKKIEGITLPSGIIDITLYRDDIHTGGTRAVGKTDIGFSIENKKVILIDDVLFTGRTIRAAMDAIMDFGRPSEIQLAVLIDRGHRELPIRADYVGRNIPTSKSEKVVLEFKEDGSGSVTIVREN